MTERTTILQRVPFLSMGFNPDIEADILVHRAMGDKYPITTGLEREWSAWSVDGIASYTEITYPLASIVASPATPTNLGGTAYQWSFESNASSGDVLQVYSPTHGDSTKQRQSSLAYFTDFILTADAQDTATFTGDMIANLLKAEHMIGADEVLDVPTPLATTLFPILPHQICVYADDSSAALGSTLLSSVYDVEFSISSRVDAKWVFKCSADDPTTWATVIEIEPEVNLVVSLEADDQGLMFLKNMRESTTKFFRVEATGPKIGVTAFDHLFRLDFAGVVNDISEFQDDDGVTILQWTWRTAYDATYGKAYEITVNNDQASLAETLFLLQESSTGPGVDLLLQESLDRLMWA